MAAADDELLPENISSRFPDRSPGDTAHQRHHDIIHARLNKLNQSGGDSLVGHIESETPHPAYDDIPDLATLIRNRLV